MLEVGKEPKTSAVVKSLTLHKQFEALAKTVEVLDEFDDSYEKSFLFF